ncbi:transglycosylase [Hydrogenoanaerobacterium saccharovorans]|uniref:Penicillin-binding protein 1A n=1 Tax=Hydrogenoanaerobacterium saccharovorans TaxID=474960 RepID=A0A1H7Z4K7_9FIRM|nr:biosynthetic peptidoglycan transglycosylase [Hydrogenoanaerobacterium saccharovorans]RPF48818.1 transglycosylase [Hydrogenoanaerobacterium saccharovorans]SEM53542.1 Transglycosylase [Hydrogenoanaerobacterium saccharovorans]
MKKIVLCLFSVTFLICVCFSSIRYAPVVSTGVEMYQSAVEKTSIQDKIKKIKTKETYVTLDQISQEYLDKVIDSEDRRFYWHCGIDFIATARAMYNNIKAGAFIQGGSTITQQLAKNLYFSFEKKYERKVAELLVALNLETKLTKKEILELYCNITYFGEGCYGIKEAALHYYNVEPSQLTSKQAEALVKTLKAPNNYNPNAILESALFALY